MKYLATLVVFLVFTYVHATSVLDKRIKFYESDNSIRDILQHILQYTGTPVLYEGAMKKPTMVNLQRKEGTVREILNEISGKKHKWYLSNGVLVFQNIEEVDNPFYPIKKYKFSYSLDIKDKKELSRSQEVNKFIGSLWKERILCTWFDIRYKNGITLKKNYTNASLREILLDLLKDSNNLCLIGKCNNEDASKIYKLYWGQKKLDYKLIKDSDKSFYVLKNNSFSIVPPEKEFIPENILDGNKELKCSLVFSYNDKKEAQVKINLKNISSKKLYLKDFKKENLLVFDYASKDDTRQKLIGSFLIYPPLNSDIPDNFELKPSEEKTFSFLLKGSRYIPFTKGDIRLTGYEKEYNYKPVGAKILNTPHPFSFFFPVIYFYDLKGLKYKAVNKEFVDTADRKK
jgi:hypothetical protein